MLLKYSTENSRMKSTYANISEVLLCAYIKLWKNNDYKQYGSWGSPWNTQIQVLSQIIKYSGETSLTFKILKCILGSHVKDQT